MRNSGVVRIGIILLTILIGFYAGATNLCAYTYKYENNSGYPIRIVVTFYDDAEKTIWVDLNKSENLSAEFLLKSWVAEAFINNAWEQILNFTCDVLPGDHSFSIYFKEAKDSSGKVSRAWNTITDGDVLKGK